ncbi:MAG: 1-(5-phosphoribosyl)-5-[(5-phosphoribosylamino)methylideneamino]imidazole-4-carboxamide isomerase [Oscillospiraceae bacterium]|nr:1-(5-phosphoribosyl)-5-[(5-phosphoribosylamino)methylideneamino]imidazole-4-carboxamide isomerase [Oscillospiraceae bacterium]
MLIYPAIDIFSGKAVRLFKGDYAQMTVYNENPEEVALDFLKSGATHIHLVDLEGAKSGETPNIETVMSIKKVTGLFCEIGGGIRSMEVIDRYISAGVDRVILGTAAVTNEGFVEEAVQKYGEKIAVGIDIKDGLVAIKGWTETSDIDAFKFCEKMQKIGVKTVICTDISKDGAMQGTNHQLYRELSNRFSLNIIASGGVSSIDDIKKLAELELYGAIVGKAYYTGAVSLKEAIEVAK